MWRADNSLINCRNVSISNPKPDLLIINTHTKFVEVQRHLLVSAVYEILTRGGQITFKKKRKNKEQLIVDIFSIVHYNVQKLENKIDLIELELCRFDVICISETWLDDRKSDEDIRIDNFKLFRRDRPGDHNGGTCVYIRSHIFSKRRDDLKLPNIECIWVEVSLSNKKTSDRYVLQTSKFTEYSSVIY